MDLTGKVAIVTGSGRGLGLAYATELARAGAAGLVAFLASDAAGITGQAIGIGGDRLALWSHPSEVVVELADGTGWSADAISEVWPEKFSSAQQTVGQQLPEPPK